MSYIPKSKLPDVGTTIFTIMSQLSAECNAINLAQGFPSFDPPDALLDRICHHYRAGDNQYPPMPGVPALLEAIADKTLQRHGRKLNPGEEITIATGATEGLFSSIQAMVHRSDEVIVLDPAYDLYDPAIRLAGGVTRHVPLQISANGHDFAIDWQRLGEAINAQTRMLILNFPHNPSGAVLTLGDLDRLADLIRDRDIVVLSDEVYEHIIFDGHQQVSLLSHDELGERSIVVSSFGKTFNATGWKMGYCIAPASLTREFRRVHQFAVFTVNAPVQRALADYLHSDTSFYMGLSDFYQKKRDLFCRLLQGSRFRFKPTRSTFFQILDYSDISDEPDTRAAERWTREYGVASIPLSVFCKQPYTGRRLRFCFAKDDATLADAVGRLRSI